MIGLSFDTELNRDIGVGYIGRKADLCFLKYAHPTNRTNERNPSFVLDNSPGTQQCLCGELFFLHLGMKPDSESSQASSLHRLQMQLSNWKSIVRIRQ